ncbi:unnamed protein product [Tenebrio molitor]|nr:unnamed protein product [Tenebrio molitor]
MVTEDVRFHLMPRAFYYLNSVNLLSKQPMSVFSVFPYLA